MRCRNLVGMLAMSVAVIALGWAMASPAQAEMTTFTVALRADYEFKLLGGTALNPGPETGYIPFEALGEFSFELDSSLNDPSAPTTVPFVNVTGQLQGTKPAEFLPHYITPNLHFFGGDLTNIVRDANGEVISGDVVNLEMQWEMVGQEGSPFPGVHLPTGGSDLDPQSNLPFNGPITSIPFALGNVIQGPDFGFPGVYENFQVFLGDATVGSPVVLGANRTLTVVPEPASIALLLMGAVGALGYGWRRQTAV